MKHVKLFARLGVALVAVLALGAVMAGAASAKEEAKDLLTLKLTNVEGNPPAEVGETSYGVVVVGECALESEGVLKSNSKKKDEATYSTTIAAECEEGSGESISGSLSKVQLSDKGEAKLKGSVTYTLANKCAYTIKKASFTFPTEGGKALGSAEVPASKAKGDAKTCEKKATLSLLVALQGGPGGGRPYETDLT